MCFEAGQILWIKLPFADGEKPEYPRTFLIIGVEEDYVKCLNVSSLKGKEEKVYKSRNTLINNSQSPLTKPSFAKLDALYIIEKNKKLKTCIFSNGKKINKQELEKVQKKFKKYKRENFFMFTEKRINKIVFYNYD